MFERLAKVVTFFGRTPKIYYQKTSFLHLRAPELPKDVFPEHLCAPNTLFRISSYLSDRKTHVHFSNARAFFYQMDSSRFQIGRFSNARAFFYRMDSSRFQRGCSGHRGVGKTSFGNSGARRC